MDSLTLRSILRDSGYEAIASLWQYDEQPEVIEKFLRSVAGQLASLANTTIESEFDHYGSGYASFVDLFCYPSDGSSQTKHGTGVITNGITIYLSRLTPVAMSGALQKFRSPEASSYDFLSPELVGTVPESVSGDFVQEISNVLARNDFHILDHATAAVPLSPGIHPPTILREAPYTIFDALFHWID
ncbi:MAG: hypothetical protein NXI04_03270 [Planctomycetaceae bacterium]|nr:hypothetical protein [Planctomycetaceae bacterium]